MKRWAMSQTGHSRHLPGTSMSACHPIATVERTSWIGSVVPFAAELRLDAPQQTAFVIRSPRRHAAKFAFNQIMGGLLGAEELVHSN